MANILVIGAGICGLGTALLLARDGHEVTVIDRDESRLPDSPQAAWEEWARKGVAQFRQPHNFMPGLRLILQDELADLQEALRHAGAARYDLLNPLPPFFTDRSARAIDDQLWTYTARRPVAEWVFLNAIQGEPGVTLRRGVRAVELLTGPSVRPGTPHVAGVHTASGEALYADVVIDAMGRGSRSPGWLAKIGARPPYEEQADCGFTYTTRYFQGIEPQRMGPPLMPIGTISILTLPGDNATWSVTIFNASSDKALKGLRQTGAWTNTVRACPLFAHWLDGEPITDVLAMSGVVDRYRSFVIDGSPVATGLVPVADAWACTNPSGGRGLTIGFMHAVRLRDLMRDLSEDPYTLAERYHEVTETELTPWYHAQRAADRFRFAEIEALRTGNEAAPADALGEQCASLFASMTSDPELYRAALEYVGTITPVQELFQRPGFAQRVAAAMQAMRESPPPEVPGPSREQLLDLVG